jgi:hypothetical protein
MTWQQHKKFMQDPAWWALWRILQGLPSEHQNRILAGQARAKGAILGAMTDKRASDTTRECGRKLVDIFDRMPQDLAKGPSGPWGE